MRFQFFYTLNQFPKVFSCHFTVTEPEEASFERTLYEGIIQDGVVEHEPITVTGYGESDVLLSGGWSTNYNKGS